MSEDEAHQKHLKEIEEERARVLENIKTFRPELYAIDRGTLRRGVMSCLEDIQERLLVMRDRAVPLMRGVDDGFLDQVETILEEYGWEGVGR